MVFSSPLFLLLFFPLFLGFYFNPFFRGRKFRNSVLLVFSLLFYAWGEPIFVFLMIASIIFTWFVAIKLDDSKTGKKTWLRIGIGSHILLLFVFKYVSFLAREFGLLLQKDYSGINIALPIGISFFTFQLMSYLFDIYYGKAKAQKSVASLALYIALFPQLIAGPIVRYASIEKEINGRKESMDGFIAGMERFIYGLGKKVLIANYVASIADEVFSASGDVSVLTMWLGAVCYTIQIYFDFSGYSDMAIGIGRMCGFTFPENFNYPYSAVSVTDFWRRWHMSLTSWFRDYVYVPLGGNRVGKARWIGNIFVVWTLTGFWHGANWTFPAWGLLYFCVLVLEKTTGFADKLGVLARPYTLIVVALAWTVFRADSIGAAGHYWAIMFGLTDVPMVDERFWGLLGACKIILPIAFVLSFPVWPRLKEQLAGNVLLESIIEPITIVCIFLLSVMQVVSASYNPFIYFNF